MMETPEAFQIGMVVVLLMTVAAWMVASVGRMLSLAYWWQTKEYRWDRFRVHARTKDGQSLLRPRSFWLWLGLPVVYVVLSVGFSWWARQLSDEQLESWIPYLSLLALLILLVLTGSLLWSGLRWLATIRARRLRRPTFSVRGILTGYLPTLGWLAYGLLPLLVSITSPVLFVHLISGVLPWDEVLGVTLQPVNPLIGFGLSLLQMLYVPYGVVVALFGADLYMSMLFFFTLLLVVSEWWVALWVLLTAPLAMLKATQTVQRAQRLVRGQTFKAVGITGSYGKSTTKEFLSALLAERYQVAKTPANNNTRLGLAQAVLAQLKPETEVFVGEYGAYRQGEIRRMTELLPPDISVVTAVSHQHVELFRSLQQTMRAKYELVQGLKPEGLAFFNADDENVREMAKWYEGERRYYSIKGRYQVSGQRVDWLAMNVDLQPDHVAFDLIDNRTEAGKKVRVELPLLGAQHVGNFLVAAAVAGELEVTLEQTLAIARRLGPQPGNMFPRPGKNSVKLVDDSYSSNPEGFLAALNYLDAVPKGRKVVIAHSMQELGSASADEHRRVGQAIAETADVFILLDHNQEDALREGIGRSKRPNLQTKVMEDPKEILTYLHSYLEPRDVVLLEGRMPATILSGLVEEE